MDKKYVSLFKDLAQATAASAETVMEYDRAQKDQKGLETATIMRDDFQALSDSIANAGDSYVPTKNDASKLLVGAMIIINQLQNKLTMTKKAIAGYQTDIIPVLQEIVEKAKDDEEAATIANEKFILENNK